MARKQNDATSKPSDVRLLELAVTMDSVPSSYFKYYYFKDEVLAELQAKPTTRAEDILANVPDYWTHYREQAASDAPELDPKRSRGGIHELELALDCMDAIFNDRGDVLPVNVPNQGALADFPDDLVVEVFARVDKNGINRLPQVKLPAHVLGLVKMLGEYQALAGKAAWEGNRIDAVRALASNPLVFLASQGRSHLRRHGRRARQVFAGAVAALGRRWCWEGEVSEGAKSVGVSAHHGHLDTFDTFPTPHFLTPASNRNQTWFPKTIVFVSAISR